ncbi:hypothetical protein [Tepidanaerobacter syntrophicus]|nr:hypothetical protein [Tepidanaerobacter syntrophicus]
MHWQRPKLVKISEEFKERRCHEDIALVLWIVKLFVSTILT